MALLKYANLEESFKALAHMHDAEEDGRYNTFLTFQLYKVLMG